MPAKKTEKDKSMQAHSSKGIGPSEKVEQEITSHNKKKKLTFMKGKKNNEC